MAAPTTTEYLPALEEIRLLKALYCRHADARQWDEFQRLFTADGRLRFLDVQGNLTAEIPAPSLAETLTERVGTGQPVHHVFSHEIYLDSPDEARAVWSMEDYVFPADAGEKTRRGFGQYHETYRRTSDGWRFVTVEVSRLRLEFID
jgi:hypothetical protein